MLNPGSTVLGRGVRLKERRMGRGGSKRSSLGNSSLPPLSVGLAPVFISVKGNSMSS